MLFPVTSSISRRFYLRSLRASIQLRSWYRRFGSWAVVFPTRVALQMLGWIKNIFIPKDTRPKGEWKRIVGWPVIGIIVPALAGFGYGAVGMTPPDFIIARVLFLVSAVILLAKVTHWLSDPKVHRLEWMILSFLIFGGSGVLLVGSLHWVRQRQQIFLSLNPPATTKTEQTDSPISPPVQVGNAEPQASNKNQNRPSKHSKAAERRRLREQALRDLDYRKP